MSQAALVLASICSTDRARPALVLCRRSEEPERRHAREFTPPSAPSLVTEHLRRVSIATEGSPEVTVSSQINCDPFRGLYRVVTAGTPLRRRAPPRQATAVVDKRVARVVVPNRAPGQVCVSQLRWPVAVAPSEKLSLAAVVPPEHRHPPWPPLWKLQMLILWKIIIK